MGSGAQAQRQRLALRGARVVEIHLPVARHFTAVRTDYDLVVFTHIQGHHTGVGILFKDNSFRTFVFVVA